MARKHPIHDHLADIPALVDTPFAELTQGHIHLLTVSDPARARDWVRQALQAGLVKTAADVRDADDPSRRRSGLDFDQALSLAFSFEGLRALGLSEDPAQPFPSAFRGGMSLPERRHLLGDADDQGGLEAWDWADLPRQARGGDAVHVLALHYRRAGCDTPALLESAGLTGAFTGHSLALAPQAFQKEPGGRLSMYEPFGFADGAGQPRLRGLSGRDADTGYASRTRTALDRLVEPGEFVLGHTNEYGERSYCPNVLGWSVQAAAGQAFGANGSYIAARQFHQDVGAFRAFAKRWSPWSMDAKIVGRETNGMPLVHSPWQPETPDDFRYLAGDPAGFQCPVGAHVRRANPRDALAFNSEEGLRTARLHQLLRRGRVTTTDARGTPKGDGLMFLALNADMDRQFEFINSNWIMGARFGGLGNEQDPLLGTRPGRTFTVPGCPVGERFVLPRFTTVLGGGYFLLPGLMALRFIAKA